MKAFVIAGTHSGCGKTSVSLGIMAALARQGIAVQPFKCGPDFIDPGHHEKACGRVSHNLDGWMLPHDTMREVFARYATAADVAVVEGVMGLYDGFSGTNEAGSTAQLAKILGLPVILVADARSMARSAAALVSGFTRFDPDLDIAGVIFNRVGSENHASLLREAMSVLPDVPVLGCLPRDEEIAMPSRHLGLQTAQEADQSWLYQKLADWVESGIDVTTLPERLQEVFVAPPQDAPMPEPTVRLGIARDPAFCFHYGENLRLLQLAGAELIDFSPIEDKDLPLDLDGLYFGGGYPELYAFELGQNTRLKRQIHAFHESGRPVYAECGGFMYLMNDIISPQRGRFAMTGIFPVRARMRDKFSALGYREITTLSESLLGPTGLTARGHEFHYSAMEEDPGPQAMPRIYAMSDRKGPRPDPEGFALGNTLGSYVHLHFGSNPEIPAAMVQAMLKARRNA